tara:strand:- start:5699 stop:5827 length:129 start_codon:yes stop_codon:yes gene_type:complete
MFELANQQAVVLSFGIISDPEVLMYLARFARTSLFSQQRAAL